MKFVNETQGLVKRGKLLLEAVWIKHCIHFRSLCSLIKGPDVPERPDRPAAGACQEPPQASGPLWCEGGPRSPRDRQRHSLRAARGASGGCSPTTSRRGRPCTTATADGAFSAAGSGRMTP